MSAGPWEVTLDELTAWLGVQEWATETRRSVRSSLRGFYGWAVEVGYLNQSPAVELKPIRPAVPNPRPARDEAYAAALRVADEREQLMLRLAAESGMRRAEVAQVHARDLEEDLLGWSLRVHGKGDRERTVPLSPGLALALRTRVLTTGGYAFPGYGGGHLSPRWVGKIVGRLLHRFATRAYAVDRDLLTVQQLLGHASPTTTTVYVQLPSDALRRTVQAIA